MRAQYADFGDKVILDASQHVPGLNLDTSLLFIMC